MVTKMVTHRTLEKLDFEISAISSLLLRVGLEAKIEEMLLDTLMRLW
jgi:hypothetical protein